MKVFNSKYSTHDFKKIYKSIFGGHGERTINKLKTQYEMFYCIYMKFVKGDKIEASLNKVNTTQHELTKFRENYVDFMPHLNNIRFGLNKLSSQIYEAKRLENDVRYLELVRKERELKNQEKCIQNDYCNAEKREQSLKDNLAIAREELFIITKVQGDYVKHLGVIFAISGFIFCIIKVNYESSNLKEHTREIRKDITDFQENLRKHMPSNSESGYAYFLSHYTRRGFSYITSYFSSKHNEEFESNPKRGYMHTLGKYSGVNYIMSWARSGTNDNTGSDPNNAKPGYMFYVAKYSGFSYVVWFVKGSKTKDS